MHPRQSVRDALTSALQNLFRLRRPNATAAALAFLLVALPAAGQESAKPVTTSVSAPKKGQDAPKVGIDITADVGRVYSVPDGRYVVATMPGVIITTGVITASALIVLERGEQGGPEIDLGANYARDLHPRIEWSVTGNYYRYLGLGYDMTWSTGVRIKLR